MRQRGILALPALALSALSVSCPRPVLDAPTSTSPSPAPAPAVVVPHALVVPERAGLAEGRAEPVADGVTQPAKALLGAPSAEAENDPLASAPLPPELIDDGSDEVPEVEPPPVVPPPARELDELASLATETWIFAEPRWTSRRIGSLRAGAIVTRRAKPSGSAGCADGWYHIEPRGYVCIGATATLNIHDLAVEASSRRPVRRFIDGAAHADADGAVGDGLPYLYGMSRAPTPTLYGRLPTEEEQRRVETDLASHLRRAAVAAREPDFFAPPPPDPMPSVLLYGLPAPTLALGRARRAADALVLSRARTRSGFAMLSTFDHEGRRFGLTTDLAVVPIDRTRVVRPSTFHGLALTGDLTLPVAFTKHRHAARIVPETGKRAELRFREAVPLSGRARRAFGADYVEALDSTLIRADDVVRVDSRRSAPAWATGERKWIDISIGRQSLVAYEGTRPVYVTLVSTGADGLGDPETTRSTIQGVFLIHTKYVTVTMDGDKETESASESPQSPAAAEPFDFRDVPFVQYFTGGFALHAAYWHDDFGTPRSHGCVNLAPLDASWLFEWTTPAVPPAWHAALSLRKGTLVYIHP